MEKESILQSETGQAMTEYAILAVMVISSSAFLIKVFPYVLRDYYQFIFSLVGMPVG